MFAAIRERLFKFFGFRSPPVEKEKSKDTDCILEKPWRSIDCSPGLRQGLTKEIIEYTSPLNSVEKIRVLFLGQIGAGKSSFLNSVDSVFRGYVINQASAGTDDRSVTRKAHHFQHGEAFGSLGMEETFDIKKYPTDQCQIKDPKTMGSDLVAILYRTYQVKDGINGKPLPIIFCDTMGLEENEDACLKIDDVINIFKGHIPDKYQFNPNAAMQPSTPGYIKSPSLKDQIHCLVFVIDGSKVEILPAEIERKLKEIRQKANELELPQLVILTKVDEVSSVVKHNISNVYRSRAVKQKMYAASGRLGIPLTQIVPVINYCSEVELKEDVDILILLAVRQIVRFAQRYLENFCSNQSPAVDKCQSWHV